MCAAGAILNWKADLKMKIKRNNIESRSSESRKNIQLLVWRQLAGAGQQSAVRSASSYGEAPRSSTGT